MINESNIRLSDIELTLEDAIIKAKTDNSIVVVFGSFFIMKDVRNFLKYNQNL